MVVSAILDLVDQCASAKKVSVARPVPTRAAVTSGHAVMEVNVGDTPVSAPIGHLVAYVKSLKRNSVRVPAR